MDEQLVANKRLEFEQQIQLYNGDDPLDLRYKFVLWIEANYPNKGIADGLTELLNDTLNQFVNHPQYNQDKRYVTLLVKYIELQPNPLELYQLVYDQGRGTECAVLYCSWAACLEKIKDFKSANQIYQMAIEKKAEPFEQVQQAHVLFQLNVGRNMLGMSELPAANTPVREACRNLQPNSIQPLHVQQNPLPLDPKQQHRLPESNMMGSGTGGAKPKQRTKPYKTFTCPVAVFEPEDDNKIRCYPKSKVYAVEGKEFQLEEIRAAIYEQREEEAKRKKALVTPTVAATPSAMDVALPTPEFVGMGKHLLMENNVAVLDTPVERQKSPDKTVTGNKPASNMKKLENNFINKNSKQETLHPPEPAAASIMALPHTNTSLLNSNQSFTVNTKEAMHCIQEMWKSPSPVAVPKRPGESTSRKSQPFKAAFKLYTDEGNKEPVSCKENVNNENVPAFKPVSSHFPISIYTDENAYAKRPEVVPKKSIIASRKSLFVRQDVKPEECFDRIGTQGLPLSTKENLTPMLNEQPKTSVPIDIYNDDNMDGRGYAGTAQNAFGITAQSADLENMTCNTNNFQFVLPSSTPLISNQSRPNHASADKNNAYSSFVMTDDAVKTATNTDLSMILEASKERYSSSSGSNSSGKTPLGSVAKKQLYQPVNKGIKVESVPDLEKDVFRLTLDEDVDPFCPKLISRLLANMNFPQKHHKANYVRIQNDAPQLRENSTIVIGKDEFKTEKELGKGAYAKVVKAVKKGHHVGLKYQKPACEWEYYIASEIQARLKNSPVVKGFIKFNKAYIYNNASIMETDWASFGSLINIVNIVKTQTGKPLPVNVATLLSIQLFSIVEHLHKCKIIHGDIKPDNFVLHSLPTTNSTEYCIKLIDFGRSIDMSLLPEGMVFKTVVTTDGFQCNEMKQNRPWTYQTDLYGLAGTAYCLLMGDYMKVLLKRGKWAPQHSFYRYMHRDVWGSICEELLNVTSCSELPDLNELRTRLEDLLSSMDRLKLQQELNSVANLLNGF